MKKNNILIYTPIALIGILLVLLGIETVKTNKNGLGSIILFLFMVPISYSGINYYINSQNNKRINLINSIQNKTDFFNNQFEISHNFHQISKVMKSSNNNLSKLFLGLGFIQIFAIIALINMVKMENGNLLIGLSVVVLLLTILMIGIANIAILISVVIPNSKKISQLENTYNINYGVETVQESKFSINTAIVALGIVFIYYFIGKSELYFDFLKYMLDITNIKLTNRSLYGNIYYQISMLLLIAIPAIYLIYNEKGNKQPKYYLVTYFFGIMLLTTVIFVTLNSILFTQPDEQSKNETSLDLIKRGNDFLFFIMAVILAPIMEELVFRKGLAEAIYSFIRISFIKNINQKAVKMIATIISIIISASLFAFIHTGTEDKIHFLSYLGGAIILSTSYFVSGRRIIVPIILHMLNNAMAF
jgi:membrane protease YdiL (CAAX protease family)